MSRFASKDISVGDFALKIKAEFWLSVKKVKTMFGFKLK